MVWVAAWEGASEEGAWAGVGWVVAVGMVGMAWVVGVAWVMGV